MQRSGGFQLDRSRAGLGGLSALSRAVISMRPSGWCRKGSIAWPERSRTSSTTPSCTGWQYASRPTWLHRRTAPRTDRRERAEARASAVLADLDEVIAANAGRRSSARGDRLSRAGLRRAHTGCEARPIRSRGAPPASSFAASTRRYALPTHSSARSRHLRRAGADADEVGAPLREAHADRGGGGRPSVSGPGGDVRARSRPIARRPGDIHRAAGRVDQAARWTRSLELLTGQQARAAARPTARHNHVHRHRGIDRAGGRAG